MQVNFDLDALPRASKEGLKRFTVLLQLTVTPFSDPMSIGSCWQRQYLGPPVRFRDACLGQVPYPDRSLHNSKPRDNIIPRH